MSTASQTFTASQTESASSRRAVVQNFLDRANHVAPPRDGARHTRAMRQRIDSLLRVEDAVVVAHYYTAPEIQVLAEETGGCVADSLEMARFGRDHSASTLVVAGVRFMGETAKILTPTKRVLMPTLEATCSLDVGCPAEEFSDFRKAHPERVAVVYANTSAAVKAQADWVVTSSIARSVVEHLDDQGKAMLWAPDQHLGRYIRSQTDADMLLWEGSCVVHEEFRARGILDLKAAHPDAAVLAHPEAPLPVLELADAIGSTSQIVDYAQRLPQSTFIVATDQGLFHRLRQVAPDRQFLIAPTAGEGASCRSCSRCPWMAMNHLENLADSLEQGCNEVSVPDDLAYAAMIPLQRMLDFAKAPTAQPSRSALAANPH